MPYIAGYIGFGSLLPETGALHNVLLHHGAVAPHSGQVPSEALLLGIAGGLRARYDYSAVGTSHVSLLTVVESSSNDPVTAICAALRLPLRRSVTVDPIRAATDLETRLAAGDLPLVWVHRPTLPFAQWEESSPQTAATPVVVCAADEIVVCLADRPSVPIVCHPAELAAARAADPSIRHTLMVVGAPAVLEEVDVAVREGIAACVKSLEEDLVALTIVPRLVSSLRHPRSWAELLGFDGLFYHALLDLFTAITVRIPQGGAGRRMYADFLDEAALILRDRDLSGAAAAYRRCAEAWDYLSTLLLPDSIAPLAELAFITTSADNIFRRQGTAATERLQTFAERRKNLLETLNVTPILRRQEIEIVRNSIAEQIIVIHRVEMEALSCLTSASKAAI